MDSNLQTYNSKNVVSWYDELSEITKVELIVFEKYNSIISQANLLDIGIGGGRTTNYLLNKCKNYTGIDYSQGFVDVCKLKFKGAKILLQDARNLSSFNDNTFDFVNFSFNGIDYVDLAGREKILSEINRVLKPNGLFFFSTHNKSHFSFNKHPWLNKENSMYTNLKTLLKLAPFILSKLKNNKNEVYTKDYAIINDAAHNYNLMTFYSTPQFTKKQLLRFNYVNISLLNKEGNECVDEKLDDWIFVTCTKS